MLLLLLSSEMTRGICRRRFLCKRKRWQEEDCGVEKIFFNRTSENCERGVEEQFRSHSSCCWTYTHFLFLWLSAPELRRWSPRPKNLIPQY
jgi:hypothetical protein